jgi:hypothetical protein
MSKPQVRIDRELVGPLAKIQAHTGLTLKPQVNLILREHLRAKGIAVPDKKP